MNDHDDIPACRICGCTDDVACPGGCAWVQDPAEGGDLCSSCFSAAASFVAAFIDQVDLEASAQGYGMAIRAVARAWRIHPTPDPRPLTPGGH